MNTELGGEVSNRRLRQVGSRAGQPGVSGGQVGSKSHHYGIVATEKGRVLREDIQPFRANLPQQLHRIVGGDAPQGLVDRAKEFPGLRVPAPPKVIGKFAKPVDTRGQCGGRKIHALSFFYVHTPSTSTLVWRFVIEIGRVLA